MWADFACISLGNGRHQGTAVPHPSLCHVFMFAKDFDFHWPLASSTWILVSQSFYQGLIHDDLPSNLPGF